MQALQGSLIDAISIPAGEFTGDFYFTSSLDESLWFAVGDVAGKGLQAAIYMVTIQEELERLIRACPSADPAEVVAGLHGALRDILPGNRFATLVVGRLMPDYRLQLVNAGHCKPILLRNDGRLETIGSNGPVVGILPCPAWQPRTLAMEAGETLVLYSDGVLEAESPAGEEFGLDRILDALRGSDDPVADLHAAVERFAGCAFRDDLTIFALTAP